MFFATFLWLLLICEINCTEDASTDGNLRSPGNIVTAKAIPQSYGPFPNFSQIPAFGVMKIENNGQTVKITPENQVAQATISKGPLEGEYKFAEIHFHWGKVDSYGSDHQIDGQNYPLEMHILFYNTKHADLESAMKKVNGLVVIAVLFKMDNTTANNENFNFINEFGNLTAGVPIDFDFGKIRFTDLLPVGGLDTPTYYTYDGSLTTRPYYESVTWLVRGDFGKITSSQMRMFRGVLEDTHESATLRTKLPDLSDRPVHSGSWAEAD